MFDLAKKKHSLSLRLNYTNSEGLQKRLYFLKYILFQNTYYLYSSVAFMVLINLVIILSMFLDYLRQAIFGAYIDPYVDAILIFIISAFLMEILIYIV